MTDMNAAPAWHDDDALITHLAGELVRGRLALVLGAGVSSFYGLPQWRTLVDGICKKLGEKELGPGEDPVTKIGAIRAKHFKGKPRAAFLAIVKATLYDGITLDFDKIRKYDTLVAIGSLVMASRRGSAAKVVNFNFDDLVEIFLEYHGFVTASIWTDEHWASNHDVTVYHPHGFLPLSPKVENSDDIVFGTDEYFKIMSDDLWRPLLQTIFRTHTIIQIGLSGTDQHLQWLLAPLKPQHAIKNERFAYFGVRFTTAGGRNPDIEALMDNWGVHTHVLASYEDDLPKFLFKICQQARELRTRSIV